MKINSKKAMLFIAFFFLTYSLLHSLYLLNKEIVNSYERLHLDESKELPLKSNLFFKTKEKGVDKKLIMFGDSRIKAWVNTPYINDIEIINLGKIGLTSSELYKQIIDLDINHLPEYALIQIGINDFKIINFYPQKEKLITERYFHNLELILNYLAQFKTKVFLSTIICANISFDKWLPFWTKRTTFVVDKANERIKLYDRDNLTVLNFDNVIGCNYFEKNLKMSNTLHLNDDGYSDLNVLLQEYLDKNKRLHFQ